MTLVVGLLAVSLWTAGAASAHVTVHAVGATQGGWTVLTFQVPTESDTASTTELTVQFPTDHPLAFVSVQPHSGWSFKVTKSKLAAPVTTDDGTVDEAVSEIHWTADNPSSAIAPGEFDQFNVSAGPLPKVTSLSFKALQTYSDGSVVKWIEQAAPGSGAEPEHPAPSLELAAATTGDAAAAMDAKPASTATKADDSGGTSAAATAGIVLGAAGVLLGLAAVLLVLRRGRPTSVTANPTPSP